MGSFFCWSASILFILLFILHHCYRKKTDKEYDETILAIRDLYSAYGLDAYIYDLTDVESKPSFILMKINYLLIYLKDKDKVDEMLV